jgi:hypothetical protein
MSLETAKHWIMIIVSVTFLVLYGAALTGVLRPVTESSIAERLEPIIFILIGFYFGQLPFTQSLRSRKRELERVREKLDELQAAKDQVQREHDAMGEKIANAKIALDRFATEMKNTSNGTGSEASKRSAEIVRNILGS